MCLGSCVAITLPPGARHVFKEEKMAPSSQLEALTINFKKSLNYSKLLAVVSTNATLVPQYRQSI